MYVPNKQGESHLQITIDVQGEKLTQGLFQKYVSAMKKAKNNKRNIGKLFGENQQNDLGKFSKMIQENIGKEYTAKRIYFNKTENLLMCIIYISVGWRSAEGKDYIPPTQSP